MGLKRVSKINKRTKLSQLLEQFNAARNLRKLTTVQIAERIIILRSILNLGEKGNSGISSKFSSDFSELPTL